MRHIITLSLVFFSLTHLAKAERVEGLRLIAEKYCDKQQSGGAEQRVARPEQDQVQHHPHFLSSSQLTLIGVQPAEASTFYMPCGHVETSPAIREGPRNNSP